jgi:hypothetical protein
MAINTSAHCNNNTSSGHLELEHRLLVGNQSNTCACVFVHDCACLCMFVFAVVPQNMATAGLPPLTQRPQVDLRNKSSFD